MIRIVSLLLCAALLVSVCPLSASAANDSCTVHEGSNVSAQNYTVWASPLESYLHPCKDGTLMRVQVTANEGVLIEYYDASYTLQSVRQVGSELPWFGGFYATDSHYYLLTGQCNYTQQPDIECYRLTKYDHDWNFIASAGLYDCNTTVPFDAGSARFAQCGKYLIVRTCHEMYQSSDGLNHQANVTIQFDTETMTVTDSFCGVMNIGKGYVSHSFNQFALVENNRLVAVDHGDAYPRSISLVKYSADVSRGTFYSKCDYTSLLDIPGEIGLNATGVSIGGFVASNTTYLVAGNKVDLAADPVNFSGVRNIFVSVMDKATGGVTVRTITNYTERGASTPHLVSFGTDRFMLLWEYQGKVWYVILDETGTLVSPAFAVVGSLSDCVPVVFDDRLVWYTWNDEVTTFYEIPLEHPVMSKRVEVVSGHDYVSQGTADGEAVMQCTKCGETKLLTVPTGLSIRWLQGDSGSYWFTFQNPFHVGDTLKYYLNCEPIGVEANDIEILISDPTVVSGPSAGGEGTFTMVGLGTAEITIRAKYAPDVFETFTVQVDHPAGEGHTYAATWSTDEDHHWHECACGARSDEAAHAFSWVVDLPATETSEGKKHKECGVCGLQLYVGTRIPMVGSVRPGDVDENGKVNTTDARLTLQYAAQRIDSTALNLTAADVDGNGKVNTTDARLILQYAAQRIEVFPVERAG